MWCSPRPHLRKKGVSTVAGAVFFVVILVSVITGVLLWSMATQRKLSDLEARRLSQNLALDIEFLPGPPKAMDITVRNNGPEAVKLVAVWITNTTYHLRIDLTEQEVSIRPGEEWVYTVEITWTSGETYVVKVVTSLGRVFATSEEAP